MLVCHICNTYARLIFGANVEPDGAAYSTLPSRLLLAALNLHLFSDCSKAFVGCPDKASFDKAGGEEMDINQADTTAVEAVALNKEQNLVVVSFLDTGERMNKGDDLFSVLQVAAGNFANHEWVSTNLLRIQQGCKVCTRLAEVINPH